MNKITFALGGFVAATLFAVAGLFLLSSAHEAKASIYNATVLGVATTTNSFSITTSSRVLATTTNALGLGTSYSRVYATVCNPNANPVYLALNGDKKAGSTNVTTIIAAAAGYSACYEVTDRNMYQGSIQASSTNETATTVTVSDYVQ